MKRRRILVVPDESVLVDGWLRVVGIGGTTPGDDDDNGAPPPKDW